MSHGPEPAGAFGQVGGVQLDDVALMRGSVGEPELFEVIFDRYYRTIWGFLARLGGTECAEELASEVFLTAFARRDSYEPDRGAVKSWLYGIAVHKAQSRRRRLARGARAIGRLANRSAGVDAPMEAVEDALAGREDLRRVNEALRQLSPSEREIIVLFAWERLSYEEIAAALGVELGTVRSRLSRARAKLRELAGLSGQVTTGSPQTEEVR